MKIYCESKPIADLFCEGKFNSLDLDRAEISNSVRMYLEQNTAAAALFEYSCQKNDKGEQVSKKIEEFIKKTPEDISYKKFFRDAFYGVSYADYLFSLPMGAGKTYLMAAFIYLDLYFTLSRTRKIGSAPLQLFMHLISDFEFTQNLKRSLESFDHHKNLTHLI